MTAAPSLSHGAWADDNRRRLEALLRDLARRPGRQVAVFDWDHTMLFGCHGEAVFRAQLDELELRWSPDQLEALLSATAQLGPEANGSAIAEDVRRAWRDVEAQRSTPGAIGSPAHEDLCAKLGFLYDALERSPAIGPPIAYQWLVDTLAGCDPASLRRLSLLAMERGLKEPIGRGRYVAATDGQTGRVTFGYATGIRRQPEMEQLAAALEGAGVEVWVVTASHEAAVQAAIVELGLAIKPERVRGALVSSRLSSAPGRARPTPFRRGKVEIIEEEIGVAPVFVAGDAISDLDMLTTWPETEVRLLIDRGRAELYEMSGPGDVLVQGRDEPSGCFLPATRSRPLPGGAVRD